MDQIKNERQARRAHFGSGTAAVGSALLILLWAGAGCKSSRISGYVSPRVEGRVVNAQTRQPLKDVQVQRVSADDSYRFDEPPKGGQLMHQHPPIRTAADGTFVLESLRDFALFRKVGWYSVTLSFQEPGYAGIKTNFTLAESTNSVNGEPLVKAGDILLVPVTR